MPPEIGRENKVFSFFWLKVNIMHQKGKLYRRMILFLGENGGKVVNKIGVSH